MAPWDFFADFSETFGILTQNFTHLFSGVSVHLFAKQNLIHFNDGEIIGFLT